jgi:hypothetical protein
LRNYSIIAVWWVITAQNLYYHDKFLILMFFYRSEKLSEVPIFVSKKSSGLENPRKTTNILKSDSEKKTLADQHRKKSDFNHFI